MKIRIKRQNIGPFLILLKGFPYVLLFLLKRVPGTSDELFSLHGMPKRFLVITDKALALWSLQNICHLDGGEYRENLIENMENEQVLIS